MKKGGARQNTSLTKRLRSPLQTLNGPLMGSLSSSRNINLTSLGAVTQAKTNTAMVVNKESKTAARATGN